MIKTELKVLIDESWQREAVEAIARRFESSHPEAQVIVEVLENGEIRDCLYSNNRPADIVQLFNGDLADCHSDGLLLDLNRWLGAESELFHPSIVRFVEFGGKYGAVPLNATMKGIFYNKLWFDKAGVPYPEEGWNWECLQDAAVRLQSANVSAGEDRYAVRISFHHEYIGLLLLTSGTDWTNPNRTKSSGYANGPEAVKAVTWAADLVHKHRVAQATQDYFKNSDLLNNECGIILDYYIMLHELEPKLNDNLGIAGLPSFREGKRINEPWVSGFGIPARSEHPELAWQLLKELACTNNELTRLVTEGFIAPLRSVFADVGHDRNPFRQLILKELDYGGPLPPAATAAYCQLLNQHVNPALAQIAFHGADVQETLDLLAAKLDKALELMLKKEVDV
ncbi:extracellular solute-binding protein [Paenibacillus thermotolerans]|uniref:extracellular solute-binding protein n=1 Tax=Paenibacillus thermotolerans TaxID=3027807 RepID=UPI0023681236|nr:MULTISPECIES: extracellular solute-binding protein [unclassified Paenibacillus]